KGRLSGFEECGEAGGDGWPGEMPAVGEGVLLAEAGAEFGIGEKADEGFVKFGGVAGRCDKHTGISDWPGGLRPGKRDHGHAGGNARDSAATAGGNRSAYEEEHIGGVEAIHHLLVIENAFHGNIHGQILKTFTKRGFAEFGVAAENGEAQFAEFLRGVADGDENNFRFAGTRLSTGDGEDTNCGSGTTVANTAEVLFYRNGNGQIGADGNKMSARGRAREPRELFERNGENGQVSGGQSATHGVELNASS